MYKSILISFFCLAPFLSHINIASADPLAADTQSAKYRTGRIDPIINRIPQTIRNNIQRQPRKYLPLLINYLKQNSKNKFHLVKLIHDWITDNIKYDKDKFHGVYKGYSKPYDILRHKRTVCGGYARLFNEMARLAGIKSIYIRGLSRNFIYSNNKLGTHAWNGVSIKGKWYIVDTTHDGRGKYQNGKFSKKTKYRDTNLFIKPKYKMIINWTRNPKEQFVANRPNKTQFLAAKKITLSFKKFQLRFEPTNDFKHIYKHINKKYSKRVYHIDDVINTQYGRTVTLKIQAPKHIRILARLKDLKNKKYYMHALNFLQGNLRVIKFNAPFRGTFKAIIFAKDMRKNMKHRSVYSFYIKNSGGKGRSLPFDYKLYKQAAANFYRINFSEIKNYPHHIAIKINHGAQSKIFAKLYDHKRKKIKGLESYSLSKHGRLYFFQKPNRKKAWIRIFAKNKNEKWHSEIAVKKIESLRTAAPTPLPINNLRIRKAFYKYGLKLISPIQTQGNGFYQFKVKSPDNVKLFTRIYHYNKRRRGTKAKDLVKTSHVGQEHTITIQLKRQGYYQVYLRAKNQADSYYKSSALEFYLRKK